MIPDFLVIGAQKAATTTIHYQLAMHPDINMTQKKEIHYFSVDENYKKGDAWYRRFFTENDKIKGESSALYHYFPYCPARIYEHNPDIKMIFCIRNPIDRAFSDYLHEVRKGHEELNFEQAIMAEPGRLKNGWWEQKSFGYMEKGKYYNQLKNFYKLFPEKNILVLVYDDLIARPVEFYRKIFKFLNVDVGFTIKDLNLKYNTSKAPVITWLPKIYIKSKYKHNIIFRNIYKLNLRNSKKKINEKTRKILIEMITMEISKLSNLIGRDLSMWIK